MTDFKLTKENNYYDISIADNGDIEQTDGLETSILLSLFSDKRASSNEVILPENRSGWIGDLQGFSIGSKLWLIIDKRLEDISGNLAVDYATECLQWLKDDNILNDINVSYTISNNGLLLDIKTISTSNIINSFSYNLIRNTINGN